MAQVYRDWLFDEEGDIIFKNGDIADGESDYDHVIDIMIAAPGHWRQYPKIGVNSTKYINSKVDNIFLRTIRLNLQSDGFKTINVKRNNKNEIIVNAVR